MNQIVTKGIVLSRVNYQEADRILTIITPDKGKIRAIAKGVRKIKSKLAGGIELFSESQITYIPGRGEIDTLISARMQKHFGNIAKDIDRTMLGYDFLKRINKITEDNSEAGYYSIIFNAMGGLDDSILSKEAVELWFILRLLQFSGHSPNLLTDKRGDKLVGGSKYLFDYDSMSFSQNETADISANHIKLMRLGVGSSNPSVFMRISDSNSYIPQSLSLCRTMISQQLNV